MVFARQIAQVAPSGADHLQEPASGAVVSLVLLHVLDQLIDSLGQHGHLNVRRSRIRLVSPVPLYGGTLLLFRKRHLVPSLFGAIISSDPMRPIKTFTVRPSLPNSLARLDQLAHNLWWCWHRDAVDLFERIDRDTWARTGHNPVMLLGAVDQARLAELAADP